MHVHVQTCMYTCYTCDSASLTVSHRTCCRSAGKAERRPVGVAKSGVGRERRARGRAME